MSPQLQISTGEAKRFEIAGVGIRLVSGLTEGRVLVLPSSFRSFETPGRHVDIGVHISCLPELSPSRGRLVYDSRLHWRALSVGDDLSFEFLYPPTSRIYCRATVCSDYSEADVAFSDAAFRELGRGNRREWDLPYPLDQLLLVPALALRGSVLLHASGAVLPAGAHVFAGHSGDGKSTLSGLLANEGVPLLSDERVAIQKTESGFVAHGTPWPGEGDVVSNASERLRALFILRKASSHSIASAENASLTPELIARAIVPYYLPEIASRIFGLFADLSEQVPVRELRFARQPGLKSVLLAA